MNSSNNVPTSSERKTIKIVTHRVYHGYVLFFCTLKINSGNPGARSKIAYSKHNYSFDEII
jgi:hypothetical protein